MKTTLLLSLIAMLGLSACGTDYKEKHEEIDREEAQERLEDAESVNMDGDTIEIED